MIIQRKKYLDMLISGEGNNLVKIVTGVRRCGKSFLLFKLFRNYLTEKGVDEQHIIELSLDDLRNKKLRTPETLLEYIDSHLPNDTKTTYIILDEVQLVQDFVEVLLSLLHTPFVDVYVSGSNSKFLSKDVVTEFRGRGDEIRVFPLSFSEFYSAVGGDKSEVWKEYYTYGGLPQILEFDSEKKNPSQDLREVRSDTKSKPRIDYSTPIEIFICELQKVKNENQDTMEYEAYTKAFDKKEKA